MNCVIYFGRFSPFTVGHLDACRQAKEMAGEKVFLIASHSKIDARKPFSKELRTRMYESIRENHSDLIADFTLASTNADIKALSSICREKGYEPVAWIFGDDSNFLSQSKYLKENQLSNDFRFIQSSRLSESISGTQARGFLVLDDEESFKSIIPECCHRFYRELQCELKNVLEFSKSESVGSHKDDTINKISINGEILKEDVKHFESLINSVLEKSMYINLSGDPEDDSEVLGGLNSKDLDFYKNLHAIKQILIKANLDAWLKKEFYSKNLPVSKMSEIRDFLITGFVGDTRDLNTMQEKGSIKLSSTDLSEGFNLENIDAFYSRYFSFSFLNSLKELKYPAPDSIDFMECYMCLLTDYVKANKNQKADLVNPTSKKLVEIKPHNSRLGNSLSSVDGVFSVTSWNSILGISLDSSGGWTKGLITEAENLLKTLTLTDDQILSLVESLKNYDSIEISDSIRSTFKENVSTSKWLGNFMMAIQLYCFMNYNKIGEILFFNQDISKVIGFYNPKSFSDIFKFVSSYLEITGSWSDKNSNKSAFAVSYK